MTNNKQTRKLTELRNWDKNPRGIKKEKFDELKKRITRHGQIKPLIITPDGEVLGGNMRLRAMTELGVEDVWVSVVEPKTEAEKIEIALTDNEEMGYYEDQALAELIEQYKNEIDLTAYSIHLDQPKTLEEILAEFSPQEIEEDEAPPVSDEPAVSKLGEVYQLGKHRVMCGDSTKIEDVGKLMGEQRADLLLTDPPYNVEYVGKTKDALTIQNDKMDDNNFLQFLIDAFTTMFMFAKDGASFYIWHADSEGYNFRNACKQVGLTVRQCLIWNKNSMVMGRQDYQWKHEPCLYGWKDGASHSWYSDRKQTTIIDFDRPSRSEDHPTMKPVGLMAYSINNSSKAGDVVLDTFLGSGSTLIACEQTNRICYGMELDPRYVDVIRKRYAKFTNPDTWKNGWQEMTPVITIKKL